MIHSMYLIGNLSSTSSENKPPYELLPVHTHKIFLHISTANSDASAYQVLLVDLGILNPTWSGAGL